MKINLFPIAYRSTMFAACAAALYYTYMAITSETTFTMSIAPFMTMTTGGAFWAIVWCVTPSSWWDV
jgi:hypothetical protein